MWTSFCVGSGRGVALGLGALVLAGCDVGFLGRMSPPPPDGGFAVGGSGSTPFVPAPDTRPAITPAVEPPPVSGGTLLALRAGGRVVVADSDRDRVVFVDLETLSVEAIVPLGDGSEPGRLVEGDGEAHVLLRGTGEVLTIDLTSYAIVSRRAVCRAPRGIVFDEESGTILVACLEGRVVELPASEGEPIRSVASEVDLRDLVRSGGRLFATTFRRAEVLELDENLAVERRFVLPALGAFTPEVAWRAVAGPNGSVVITHQRATTATITLTSSDPSQGTGANGGVAIGGSSSAYGSVDPCSGIVESAITVLAADGTFTTSARIAGSVLPVDLAVYADGHVAVASAGTADPAVTFGVSNSLGLFDAASLDASQFPECTSPGFAGFGPSPAVSVAIEPNTRAVVVQNREPASLIIYDPVTLNSRELALGGWGQYSTGHELFHRDVGGGLACASCHPEGTDDGRVWNFTELGPRRTQPLDVELRGSAPFHWDGELADFTNLVDDVMVSRMGGMPQIPERVQALENFIYGFKPRPGARAATDPAALRGKALFESDRTGCGECHRGATFTSYETANIGKGKPTQIPSLLGVSARPPFMHDGCAATLRDRFSPACGGAMHGFFADLAASEVDDLVSYLETL